MLSPSSIKLGNSTMNCSRYMFWSTNMSNLVTYLREPSLKIKFCVFASS